MYNYIKLKRNMYHPTLYVPQMINQDLGLLYANYMFLNQKLSQNSIYQCSTNLNSIISHAVSMDFKKFQTQFLVSQINKRPFNTQVSVKSESQKVYGQISEKKEKKIKKNLNVKYQKIEKEQTIQLSDQQEKIQKQEPKSKDLTVDESSEKIQFDDCSIKENQNTDKKTKKTLKSQKLKLLSNVDLIEFARIRKDPLQRRQIQKRKNNLLMRQVQNWNEVQKTRRNEKLQLRRIKY